MKFNTPIPQPLQKECSKAANIFKSFVDTHNQGLDGIIPRSVLQHAKGFAIFSVFKAGFVLSARAGSGVVIARLADGTWSAPSAIGTAGMGFGGQAGAEVTDFLIVLNSHSAVKSFMAAGSLTLGGNMSIAVGPLGRNGEASSALNTNGAIATMYSYSKTKGLFGGLSFEGSVIVERQDANAIAYQSDVTAKMLLSGVIPPPDWAKELIQTLENRTGIPGVRNWIQDENRTQGYAFGGLASPGSAPEPRKKTRSVSAFPPASWGKAKDGGSYFSSPEAGGNSSSGTPLRPDPFSTNFKPLSPNFPTHFESDPPPYSSETWSSNPDLNVSSRSSRHATSKSLSALPSTYVSNPFLQSQSRSQTNPFAPTTSEPLMQEDYDYHTSPKAESATSFSTHNGVARAVALHDFKAVEPGDLPLSKGDIIVITEKSDRTDDWWTGTVNSVTGIFPANFVKLI